MENQKHSNVLDVDLLDKALVEDLLADTQNPLSKAINEIDNRERAIAFAEDIFAAASSHGYPLRHNEEELDETGKRNSPFVDAIEWDEIPGASTCKGNVTRSSYVAAEVIRAIAEEMNRQDAATDRLQEEDEKRKQGKEPGQSWSDGMGGWAPSDCIEDTESNEGDKELTDEEVEWLHGKPGEVEDGPRHLAPWKEMKERIHALIGQATKQAIEKSQRVESILAFIGNDLGCHPEDSGTVAEGMELADQLAENEELLLMIEKAGHFLLAYADKKGKLAASACGGMTGVTSTDDPAIAFPDELAIPALVAEGIINHSLLAPKFEKEEKKIHGPVKVAEDHSNSMKGAKHVVAVGFTLAMLKLCKDQKRRMEVIQFEMQANTIVFDYTPDAREENKPSQEKFIKVACQFRNGGGTCFDSWIDEIVDDNDQEADVILISDGAGSISPAHLDKWNSWREKEGITCEGIEVPPGAQTLRTVCDSVFTFDIGNMEQGFEDCLIRVTERGQA